MEGLYCTKINQIKLNIIKTKTKLIVHRNIKVVDINLIGDKLTNIRKTCP